MSSPEVTTKTYFKCMSCGKGEFRICHLFNEGRACDDVNDRLDMFKLKEDP